MVDLDYLIIYTNTGIPIYSYKFKKNFEISDDLILSAFLASLNQFSQFEDLSERPDKLVLEDEEVKIEYSDELKLSTLELEETVIVFYYGLLDSVTVGVGVSKSQFGSINTLFNLTQFMMEIEQFMLDYLDMDWTDLERAVLKTFESRLHLYVIHKFMDAHTEKDHCYLNNACPFRRAADNGDQLEKLSFSQKIRSRFSKG